MYWPGDRIPARGTERVSGLRKTADYPSNTESNSPVDTLFRQPRNKEKLKETTKLGWPQSRDPYIVEPPSPPPLRSEKPSLRTHSSAPPIIPVSTKREPSRSKTRDYPRDAPALPHASTFRSEDRRPADRRTQRGSRLKKTVYYSSGSESESDSSAYHSRNHPPPSPPPRRRKVPKPTRYIMYNGRSIPIAPPRDNGDEGPYIPSNRDRSQSPPGTRGAYIEDGSSEETDGTDDATVLPTDSISQAGHQPSSVPERDSSRHGQRRYHGSSGVRDAGGPSFGEVKYATPYRPEDVVYNGVSRRSRRKGGDSFSRPRTGKDEDDYPSDSLRTARQPSPVPPLPRAQTFQSPPLPRARTFQDPGAPPFPPRTQDLRVSYGYPSPTNQDLRDSHDNPAAGKIFEDFLRSQGGMGGGEGDFEDIFSQMPPSSRARARARTPEVTTVERPLKLTLEELFKGTHKKMKIKRRALDETTGLKEIKEKILEMDIKPGLKKGSKIKFKGVGDQEEGGQQDLHFVIEEVYEALIQCLPNKTF